MAATASGGLDELAEGYERWLRRQPFSERTRAAYAGQVRRYLEFLAEHEVDGGDPLTDEHARDYAVRDYKRHLKRSRRLKPRSVNLALAAIDDLYRFLGLGPVRVKREELPADAPRALDEEELRRFLRAVERCSAVRDRAIALVLYNTALRLGELAALDVDDVSVSARKGRVVVRSGKGDGYREVALNAEVRRALADWLAERPAASDERALFLNVRGGRLSSRSVDLVVRRLGREAGVELSAHVLRHTCLTRLVRAGHDLVLVAEIAGHRRLETTRRYTLPSEGDRTAAMDSLELDY